MQGEGGDGLAIANQIGNHGGNNAAQLLQRFIQGLEQENFDWEEVGADLWQVAADPETATLLIEADATTQLADLVDAAIAQQKWRPTQITFDILIQMANSNEATSRILLQSERLAQVSIELALHAEDPRTAGEVCRLCTQILDSTQGDDLWFTLLSTPQHMQQLLHIAEHTTSHAAFEYAFSTISCLLDAAKHMFGTLTNQLVQLRFLSLLSSIVRAWLEAYEGSSDEEASVNSGRSSQDGQGAAQIPRLAQTPSREGVIEALMVAELMCATNEGAAAIAQDAYLLQKVVRLIVTHGIDSQIRETAICMLGQLEHPLIGRFIVEDIETMDAHLSMLNIHGNDETALGSSVWKLATSVLEYFNTAHPVEFQFRKNAARRAYQFVDDVIPPEAPRVRHPVHGFVEDDNDFAMFDADQDSIIGPSIALCRRALRRLEQRLQEQ